MGTQTALTAVAEPNDGNTADEALAAAERALRAVETRMSTYIMLSELSRYGMDALPA